MPNIDLTNVTEAAGGGGGFHLAPGGYVLKIIDLELQMRREYVRLKFDVAEGPCAGTFANAMWPISDIMSWSAKSLPYLKAKLRALSESNDGWSAEDAFKRDAWSEFVGKRVGAIVRDRVYTGRDGTDKTGNDIYQLVPTETIASGDYVVPGVKDDRKGAKDTEAAPNPPAPAPAPAPTQYPYPQTAAPQYSAYYAQFQQPQQPHPEQHDEPLPWER